MTTKSSLLYTSTGVVFYLRPVNEGPTQLSCRRRCAHRSHAAWRACDDAYAKTNPVSIRPPGQSQWPLDGSDIGHSGCSVHRAAGELLELKQLASPAKLACILYEWLGIITADVLLTADFVSALEIAWGHGDLGSCTPALHSRQRCLRATMLQGCASKPCWIGHRIRKYRPL